MYERKVLKTFSIGKMDTSDERKDLGEVSKTILTVLYVDMMLSKIIILKGQL